jgi:hypothetical protein
MIGVRLDFTAAAKALEQTERQYPFAASLALNNLANAGQQAQRVLVRREFTLRQETFILNTIKRFPGEDFATKRKLSAGYRVDPRRDFLAKFEAGGEKHAIQGKSYVAVPLPDLRRTKKGLVPRSLYPSKFKPFADQASGISLGQQRTFIVPTKKGNRVLLQRFGGTRGRRGVRALYLFVPSVHIDPTLQFQQTAETVARSEWPRLFADALAHALETAR